MTSLKVKCLLHIGQTKSNGKEITMPRNQNCWKGYQKVGTKMKDGKRVNNCVKVGSKGTTKKRK